MIYFEDSDIIIQKVLATKIVDSMRVVLLKLRKISEKTANELNNLEIALSKAKTLQEIGVISKKIKEMQTKLLLSMSLKNRVETITNRNKARIEYFNDRLESSGIYTERYDKRALSEMEVCELDNLSEQEINLNKVQNGNTSMRFVLGENLVFVDGKLDFSVAYNKNVLRSLSTDTLTKIVGLYPYCVASVPDDMLLNISVKQNLLKAITTYVSEELKTKSMAIVNKNLGGLLSFKTEITSNVTDYMAGVQNMFDVSCKALLLQRYPEKTALINEKLKCNGRSALLPASKIYEVLSGTENVAIQTETESAEEDNEKFVQDLISSMYAEIFEEMEETPAVENTAETVESEPDAAKTEKVSLDEINAEKEPEITAPVEEDDDEIIFDFEGELDKLLNSVIQSEDENKE